MIDEKVFSPAESERAFNKMINAVDNWALNYMDQWEKVKFETKWGVVYLHITYKTSYPETYELVTLKD